MTNPYPIPRFLRQTDILVGDGGAVYGPFDGFGIWDPADIEIWAKADGEAAFSKIAATVAKVDPAKGYDVFTATFPANVPASTQFVAISRRVHERSAGVIDGTRIDPAALEKELSTQGTILQELRRDVDRGIQVQFGDGYVMDAGLADGDTLMKVGGRIVAGPNAGEIQEAQGYAEQAAASMVTIGEMLDDAVQLSTPADGTVNDAKVHTPASPADAVSAGKIKYVVPYTGGDTRYLSSKLSDVVHINDFPPLPADTWLSRAIDGTPQNGTLVLGAGPYIANFAKDRSNIRIVGERMPSANAARTALEGGTVIQGRLALNGDNITVERIGVDCGSIVCTAINGGAAMDGFIIRDPSLTTIRKHITVRDVSALCRAPADLVHAILLEGLQHVHFDNLHGYQGFAGVVIKARDGMAVNLHAYKNGQVGVHPKSNSYGPLVRMQFDNLYADDEGLGLGVGVFLYAETSQIEDVQIGKVLTKGFDKGMALFAASGQVINDLQIGSIHSITPASYGFVTNGSILQASVGEIQVKNPVSGRAVQVNDDCGGIAIGLIDTTSPSGKNLDDCVYLGGVFQVGRIVNKQLYGFSVTPGITISPAISPRAWRIGDYVGRLMANADNTGLRNGWSVIFGDTPRAVYKNGRVFMTGRIAVPATPWTGKEQCFQLPAALCPVGQKVFAAHIFGSAGSGVTYLEVNTSGVVNVLFLNTSAQFPTTTQWLNFNGVSWSVVE